MNSIKKKIIVVLPAYNAERTLKQTIEDIPKNTYDEIILVDDASHDRTAQVAKKLGLITIVHAKNQGYGANQKTCYREALKRGADIIVMLHPDYQYDPKILPSLTAPLLYDFADVVLASRILGDPHKGGALRGGMPFYKYAANRFLTKFQNSILKISLSEYHTGYRAYSKKALEAVNFLKFSDDFIFDNQILVALIKKGLRFKEVPVATKYFPEASSINFKRSLKYGWGVILNTFQ
jgi:glycosyltransferase involved in cell wall biosynthesis